MASNKSKTQLYTDQLVHQVGPCAIHYKSGAPLSKDIPCKGFLITRKSKHNAFVRICEKGWIEMAKKCDIDKGWPRIIGEEKIQ